MNKGQKQNGQTAESFETVRTEWAPHISFTETTQYTALYEKGGQGEEKSHFTSNCLKTTGINGRQHIICLLCECVCVCLCVFVCLYLNAHIRIHTYTNNDRRLTRLQVVPFNHWVSTQFIKVSNSWAWSKMTRTVWLHTLKYTPV